MITCTLYVLDPNEGQSRSSVSYEYETSDFSQNDAEFSRDCQLQLVLEDPYNEHILYITRAACVATVHYVDLERVGLKQSFAYTKG